MSDDAVATWIDVVDDDGEILAYGVEGEIEERSLSVFDVVHDPDA